MRRHPRRRRQPRRTRRGSSSACRKPTFRPPPIRRPTQARAYAVGAWRVASSVMGTLKDRLNDDLRTAMKGRDELTTSTLRMALAAVRTAEVAGKQARDLTDDEVLAVLTREAK